MCRVIHMLSKGVFLSYIKGEFTILIKNGNVITPYGICNSSILTKKGKITRVSKDISTPSDEEVIDAKGKMVFPGFIDLHIHGGHGIDICDQNADLKTFCEYQLKHGTTSLLLTTRTMETNKIESTLLRLKESIDYLSRFNKINILGIHLEGPFLSQKYKGAQNPENLQAPSKEILKKWMQISGNNMRMITLAPELENAEEVIKFLKQNGIVVSAGHSDATYDQMEEAINWGVSHVTHFFNGMRGFHHREPGILGASLLSDKVTTEIILDTIHSHPMAAKLLVKNKKAEGVALITDSVRATGMADGEYVTEDRMLCVKDGIVRNSEGNLAGSTLTMNEAVKNVIELLQLPYPEVAQMASLTPATILGIDHEKGSIEVGKDADIVILNSDFEVEYSICEGEISYKRSESILKK